MAQNGHGLGFEQKLWTAADKLRNNMDAAEYKHVVLGLIFLKYISDSFEQVYDELRNDPQSLGPEERDEYIMRRVFWVPKEARWQYLQDNAKQSTIGKLIDDAMELIEKENPSLKGVLPKDYARPALDKRRVGELIDLIGTIGLGDAESKKKDILGRVYEYFLGEFADAEGKKGGQFYTPRSIVRLLVAMIAPYKGRVYDPCCGSGGMFVQSERFIEEHQGRIDDVSIYGQESNSTTWKLCKMNLAIRGIESRQILLGDSFHNDQHMDLRADFILANPPFNISDWGGEHLRDDVRWRYGTPPTGNANFAWVQHMIHHLSPSGVIGLVLANGSMSSNTGGEGDIRKNIVEADLIDCMVALPSQLFYNTMIPACLWFIRRGKRESGTRTGETLFIDARKMGEMVSRRNRELTDEDIRKIADTYHAWRANEGYEDIPGFCKSAQLADIRTHDHILTPGRYVGIEEQEDDGIPFEEKMKELTSQLRQQMEEGRRLDEEIRKNLESIGFKI
ncbi:SAM-dependent DNA methyltransferase [candidate division KSB1 bacterium]|nr:SAM-dependent DNA methyltransferase [candidate division KSB1 bacterium]